MSAEATDWMQWPCTVHGDWKQTKIGDTNGIRNTGTAVSTKRSIFFVLLFIALVAYILFFVFSRTTPLALAVITHVKKFDNCSD